MTLDNWKEEWVENMERWGNVRGNEYWESNLLPKNKPTQYSSVTNLENFITNKYVKGMWKLDKTRESFIANYLNTNISENISSNSTNSISSTKLATNKNPSSPNLSKASDKNTFTQFSDSGSADMQGSLTKTDTKDYNFQEDDFFISPAISTNNTQKTYISATTAPATIAPTTTTTTTLDPLSIFDTMMQTSPTPHIVNNSKNILNTYSSATSLLQHPSISNNTKYPIPKNEASNTLFHGPSAHQANEQQHHPPQEPRKPYYDPFDGII